MPFEKSVADVLFMNGEYERAAEMYLEGARDGEEIAAFNYGYCLLHGYGVNQDPECAKSFFTFARDWIKPTRVASRSVITKLLP